MGLWMIFAGLILKLVGRVIGEKPYKIDEDPEFARMVKEETMKINLQEAQRMARQDTRHIRVERN